MTPNMVESLQGIVEETQSVLNQNQLSCLTIALLSGRAAKQPVHILINSPGCDTNREGLGLEKLTEKQRNTPPSPNSLALPPLCWVCPASQNVRQSIQNLSQRAASLK